MSSKPHDERTVLGALDAARVFHIIKTETGDFEVVDGCDDHFTATLTKEQMITWAEELLDLVDSCDAAKD